MNCFIWSNLWTLEAQGHDKKGNADKGPGLFNSTQESNETDALFQKHYSKELKVNEDEIPFVLAEFTENALRYIK